MKKNIQVDELPFELEGFAGGMGFKSIHFIAEYHLGYDISLDVKGYISEPVNSIYYGEVMNGEGDCEYASGDIDEVQKWVEKTICKYCE